MWIEFGMEFSNEFAFQLENLNSRQEVYYIDTSKKKNFQIQSTLFICCIYVNRMFTSMYMFHECFFMSLYSNLKKVHKMRWLKKSDRISFNEMICFYNHINKKLWNYYSWKFIKLTPCSLLSSSNWSILFVILII